MLLQEKIHSRRCFENNMLKPMIVANDNGWHGNKSQGHRVKCLLICNLLRLSLYELLRITQD